MGVKRLTLAQAGWVNGGAHPWHSWGSLDRLLLLLAVVGKPGVLGGPALFCMDHTETIYKKIS